MLEEYKSVIISLSNLIDYLKQNEKALTQDLDTPLRRNNLVDSPSAGQEPLRRLWNNPKPNLRTSVFKSKLHH